MAGLEGQFLNIQKKIRQIAVQKMQQKMDSAAEKAIKAADKLRDYDDVTGNLYRSTAIGTYYKGSLQSIHYTPGPEPTRLTLAAGERYNLDRYYRSSFSYKDSGRRAYRGQYGEGGESGLAAAENTLLCGTWQKQFSHDLADEGCSSCRLCAICRNKERSRCYNIFKGIHGEILS